jgi:hypothetical protein
VSCPKPDQCLQGCWRGGHYRSPPELVSVGPPPNLAATKEAAAKAGANARAVRPDGVARDADLLILAVPYAATADALRGAGDVTGKTIVDISNPVTPDYSALALGFSTSAAEEIQKAVPKAKVVKAFNTIFAQVLGAALGATRAQVLYAGNDAARRPP